MPQKAALHKFFEPKSVAVIGASTKPGKVGHDILRNMLSSGFQGKVYPVHPRAAEILAQKCYPSVTEIEGPVDLAVVVVPAPVVLTVMEECGQKGIEAAVVI